MNDNKDGLRKPPFSSQRVKSHSVHWLLGLEPTVIKRIKRSAHTMKRNYDSLTCVSQHQDKWQKWRKRCTPSHPTPRTKLQTRACPAFDWEQGTKSAYPAYKTTTRAIGENENISGAPAETTCLVSTENTCAPIEQVHLKKNCVTTKTCGRPSIHAVQIITTHAPARWVFGWTSHVTRYVTTLKLAECGSLCDDNWCHISCDVQCKIALVRPRPTTRGVTSSSFAHNAAHFAATVGPWREIAFSRPSKRPYTASWMVMTEHLEHFFFIHALMVSMKWKHRVQH